jgi:hypothetical protein
MALHRRWGSGIRRGRTGSRATEPHRGYRHFRDGADGAIAQRHVHGCKRAWFAGEVGMDLKSVEVAYDQERGILQVFPVVS